jgi:type II secretory ATPase GspE/PulE/Tfp pilus assembly ATPase PilB-like protein
MNSFLSSNPNDLARTLSDQKRSMEEQQTQRRAQSLNMPYVNLRTFPLNLNALSLMDAGEAQASESVIFFKDAHDMRIGTTNPDNALLKEKLKSFGGGNAVTLYLISQSSFLATFKFYDKVVSPTSKFQESVHFDSAGAFYDKLQALKDISGTTPATEILTTIFGAAVEQGSSDIHIEPEDHIVKIRFRVDGVLHDAVHLPKAAFRPIISRIKLMSKLKINIENEPQDGRFSVMNGTESLDVRVSVLPSSYGEAVVMRLLGIGAINLTVEQLGLTGRAYKLILEQLEKPNGMIITTGPTGSGKTTTLYAFINKLNEPGVKIITLEDPVEYKVEGIQQTPIDHRVDFNFAKGLRSILRQDPDIVMVGEVRDPETAETSLQAALTGHIVLTTLHTNDASGAIPRLVTMGVKTFTIAPAINAIIAQRLVRKLCTFCIQPATLSSTILDRVTQLVKDIPSEAGVEIPSELKFYHAPGCRECKHIGYKGRIGVYEVIEVNDQLRELILKEPSGMAIKEAARKNGTMTMLQDGIMKALDKVTDIEEVFRVVG